MAEPGLVGIFFVAKLKNGPDVVFQYPSNFEFLGGSSHANIDNDDEDTGDDSEIENELNSGDVSASRQLDSANGLLQSLPFSEDEFDENFTSSDEDDDEIYGEDSGIVTGQENKLVDNAAGSGGDSKSRGSMDTTDYIEEEDEDEDSSDEDSDDQVQSEDEDQEFDPENEYDNNNVMMSFEEFNNEYFIESILDDQAALAKLKYKVSHDCTSKFAPGPETRNTTSKIRSKALDNAVPATKAYLKKKISSYRNEQQKYVPNHIYDFLLPMETLADQQFEIKIDKLSYLSYPITKNLKTRPKRRRRSVAKKASNYYYSSEVHTDHNNSSYSKSKADKKVKDSQKEDEIALFSVVFAVKASADKYFATRERLFKNVVSKLTHIFVKEQNRQNYVGTEARKIRETVTRFYKEYTVVDDRVLCSDGSEASEEMLNAHFTVKNCCNEILEHSSLARALRDCYDNVLSSRLFQLNINGSYYSFNLPVQKHFVNLPNKSNGQVVMSKDKCEIGTLFDEYFYKENLFPSVSNLSDINDFYYLNSFQRYYAKERRRKGPGLNDEIVKIFRDCSYGSYSLLLLEDLEPMTQDLGQAIVKDFKMFIRRIDVTIPLSTIIKTIIQEKTKKSKIMRKNARKEVVTVTSANQNSTQNSATNAQTHHNISTQKRGSRMWDQFNAEETEITMMDIIYHLIFWEKVRFVLPITKKTKFVVSPLANIGLPSDQENLTVAKLQQHINQDSTKDLEAWLRGLDSQLAREFELQFASLPSFAEFLHYFNVPRTYGHYCKSKSRMESYLNACCWLMKNGLLVQYYRFAWLLIPSKIKLQVDEEYGIMRSSAKSSAMRNYLKNSSSPGSVMGVQVSSISNDEDSILIDPARPTLQEKRFISKMLANKSKDVKTVFYKILKYLNGRVPLELVVIKENIKKHELKKVLDEMDEFIIVNSRW